MGGLLVPGGSYAHKTIQDAVSASGNGKVLEVISDDGAYSVFTLQITGTFSATVHFECTVDGTNWETLEMTDIEDSTTKAVSATAAGIWTANVIGLLQVRARVAWTSGTSVTVTGCLVA